MRQEAREDGNKALAQAPRLLNARQKKAMKNVDPSKDRTFCMLNEAELRLFHWQVSRSQRCMRIFQSYVEIRKHVGVPDDLREISRNSTLASLESKTPFPLEPVGHSPSMRCIPQLLLREIHFIAMKIISRVGEIDKLTIRPPLREKTMSQLTWVNYSIYDPAIQTELAEEWVDNGEIQDLQEKEPEQPSANLEEEQNCFSAEGATALVSGSRNEAIQSTNYSAMINGREEGRSFDHENIIEELELLHKYSEMGDWLTEIAEGSIDQNKINRRREQYLHALTTGKGLIKELKSSKDTA